MGARRMSEFEVTVHTRVKEIYVVEAANADEARETWHKTEPVFSECIEVEGVEDVSEVVL